MPKGWASSTNAKFGKKGRGKRIKVNVVDFLKQFFLNGNLNPNDKMTAKEMHEELLREFNQQGTSIVLETFKAASSPNEEN
ncbi:1823_t:CDS:2 [Scutellospora calospora]|uniref:1823_t:CDS:1 n=1 Tax=Scutellospora calospora TaxID=85575 RepID=A0ACA9JU57_9GLOM|nr:1823_t:CDS:2 [Scutellospora calospora]